ncbi:hypothetical protein [Mycolicibacterium sp.]|uniref:hypothetical protein n=1 Tax=Mycolicibacterium sp. TaxID=2320850 RepID=UPI0025E9DFA6|nr:hypothetical protein [Mycolicibacterium sp.]
MAIQLQRKPDPLEAWHLSDEMKMYEAYLAAKALGWRGAIAGDGPSSRLELHADNPDRSLIAEMGDWLVLDVDLRRITDAQRAANYDEVTD